jgi:hypothetical protein
VTFDAGASTACSVTAAGAVTATSGTGSCEVTATKAADANYVAITSPAFSITVNKANQAAFTVSAPASATYAGGTVQATASGGSGGGAVTYDASTTPAACTVNAASGVVTIMKGTGTCVVSAAKAGDGNYNSAIAAPASIALNRASQAISFGSLAGKTYGDAAFNLNATASSGLAVSFSAGAGSRCSVSGASVTLTGAGSCVITAMQPGNADYYNAATPVQQSFTIAKRGSTATAGSGSMVFGKAVPSLSCMVNGLLAPDAGTVTCTTVVPAITAKGTYATTAAVSPSDPPNYQVGTVNGVLTVLGYLQKDCFNGLPAVKNSSVPQYSKTSSSKVKLNCTLKDPTNSSLIVNAKGNVLVEDMGTMGTASPTTVFTIATNVYEWEPQDSHYEYYLPTSGSAFLKGHYFRVTTTWDDGSTTVGWFKLKS